MWVNRPTTSVRRLIIAPRGSEEAEVVGSGEDKLKFAGHGGPPPCLAAASTFRIFQDNGLNAQ